VNFKEEADKLVRLGSKYQEQGTGEPTAYWHGIEANGLCLSIFKDEKWLNVFIDEDAGGYVEIASSPAISETPLFSSPYSSLPPIDGVFHCGSDEIGAYLEKHDWPREEPFNDNFPDVAPLEYEGKWQENCPFYQQGIDLVSGGWHFPWPDGDWEDYIENELIVWTFRDSEPWIEVFKNGNDYIVKQRIT